MNTPRPRLVSERLGVAEQHHHVIAIKQRVVDADVARGERALVSQPSHMPSLLHAFPGALQGPICYSLPMTSYQNIITIQSGKRGGRPCIRGMRIAVADVLGWLAAGMSHEEILRDYPELTEEDIRASLAYAADRERRVVTSAA